MESKFIQDFTEGSIPRKLLRFSVPFMLSNALQVVYSMVDMLVVGQIVGSYGLSAVNIGGGIFAFMAMLALGFCSSGRIYISQQIGAGQRDRLGRTIGTLFSVTLIVGVILTVLGLAFCKPLLRLMHTPPESFDMAVSYVLVCSGGVIVTCGYNMISAVLMGMGDSRHPFIFIVIASVLNIVLDLLFVGPCHMGTGGAALATILGQTVSFVFALVFLYRRKEEFGFGFRPRDFQIDRDALKILVRLGIPLCISSCAISISMLFVNSLVNTAGVIASAAFGVGIKLDDVVGRISFGIGMGVSSVVGQNFAAGKNDRVRKAVYSSWAISAVFYIVFAAAFLLFSREMFGFFTSDKAVIEMGPVFISAVVWSFPANVLMRGTQGFIQGIGNARMSLITALADGFIFRIGLSWLFGITLKLGVWGFFFGFGMATYSTALPVLVYFLMGRWTKRRVLTDHS